MTTWTEELNSTKRNTNTNNYNESENRPPLSTCNSFLSLELSVKFLESCPSSGRRRQRASKSGLSMFGLLDYRGLPRRRLHRLHSPRAERMKVKPPSPPSAQSVQTKKKPPVDLAISP